MRPRRSRTEIRCDEEKLPISNICGSFMSKSMSKLLVSLAEPCSFYMDSHEQILHELQHKATAEVREWATLWHEDKDTKATPSHQRTRHWPAVLAHDAISSLSRLLWLLLAAHTASPRAGGTGLSEDEDVEAEVMGSRACEAVVGAASVDPLRAPW